MTSNNQKIAIIAALTAFLALVSFTRANTAETALTLVLEGQPKAMILLSTKPSRAAVEGAKILSDHIRQISGVHLKITKENSIGHARVVDGRIKLGPRKNTVETLILIGESDLAGKLGVTSKNLGPGGVLIRTIGNALVLLGPDDKTPSDSAGSRHAVTTFLEDVLGCRYLWPGESGKIVPKHRTITIKTINIRFTPTLSQRRIRWSGYSERIQQGLNRLGFTKEEFLNLRKIASTTQSTNSDWMSWHRMGGTLGLKTGDGTILTSKTWDKFLREHAEWFAMQLDGSRYFHPSWPRPRLCKSNPALIEAIAQEKLKELERNPHQQSVSLMTQDGGSKAGFCMCPACKALDPQEGRPIQVWTYDHKTERTRRFEYVSLTDRMIYFYNAITAKVAKIYPDVVFTGQAYSIYRAPPVREKLHSKIVIRFVHNTVHYANDEIRRQGMADWDAWANAAGMIYWRPNLLLWGIHEGTLGVYVHKLAEDFRHISQNKCVGTDFDSCMHHWATQGLNYYVLAKLHWNPNLDVDVVIDDYCRMGFGDASEVIKRYFAHIEQLTNETAARKRQEMRNIDVTEPYTPKVIAELCELLDTADRAAGSNKTVRRRIDFLRRGLEFTELQAKVYRMLRLAQQNRLTTKDRDDVGLLLDKKWSLMRNIFQDEHYAVNVAAMCWGEWGRFKRLGWDGPSQQTKSSVYPN